MDCTLGAPALLVPLLSLFLSLIFPPCDLFTMAILLIPVFSHFMCFAESDGLDIFPPSLSFASISNNPAAAK